MILFVDDDEFGMKPFRLAIEDAGLDLRFTDSLEVALELVNSESATIQLIILDVLMPCGAVFSNEETNGGLLTGYRLLEKIQKRRPDIPIIIFSITSPSDMKVEYASENLSFLSKQDTMPAELVAAIKEKSSS